MQPKLFALKLANNHYVPVISFYHYKGLNKEKILNYKVQKNIQPLTSLFNWKIKFFKLIFANYIKIQPPNHTNTNDFVLFHAMWKANYKLNIFENKSKIKQSYLSYENRKNINNNIKLNPHHDFNDKWKNVLIFDDIITTGSTIKTCLNLLLNKEYPKFFIGITLFYANYKNLVVIATGFWKIMSILFKMLK